MYAYLKRIFSWLLMLGICLGMLPILPAEVSAADNIVIAGVDIGYADGSFFTKNGKTCKDNNNYNINGVAKASCHGRAGYSCANSTDPSCNCMRYWPTGYKETCQIDLRGTQCFGFARYCQWKVYGTYDGNSPSAFMDLTGVITESQCTGENLKQKLLGCAPATHLRSRSSQRGVHSISIISTSDSGVVYVDCNTDGGCVVRRFTVSWEELAQFLRRYGGVDYAYSYGPNQPAPDCGCEETHSGTYFCATKKDNLTIRSGHGVQYASVGSIPPGAAVTVTKASGTGENDWAHVTYNGVSGYASMAYLQKEQISTPIPDIQWWISDPESGEALDACKVGGSYDFCYRLYDTVSGKDWDAAQKSNYTVRLTLYHPDGTVISANQENFTEDTGRIVGSFTEPGTYKFDVAVAGDFTITQTHSFEVKADPITVNLSLETVSLVMGEKEKESCEILAWATGYHSGEWVLNWKADNETISCFWGQWDNKKVPLTVTAKARGEAQLTVSVKDKNSGAVLHSKTVTVKVDALEYTISYHANEGTGAPDSQTKYHGATLRLSDVKPKRAGHSFAGWSPYPDGQEPAYLPGEGYDLDESVELYAVWLPGCEEDSHDWKAATCEAAKTCSLCGKTEGEPADHTYENGVCTICGVREYAGLRGDANGDEKLNYKDALLVLRHSIGLDQLSEAAQALCDVDGKPGLNYRDALMILRASIGLETLN